VDAIGTKAVYTAATGTMKLTGHPVLQTAQLTSSGEMLIWNRFDRVWRMKGISHSVVKRGALGQKRPAPPLKSRTPSSQ
jgi:lipopolysaccharide export system protein LptA